METTTCLSVKNPEKYALANVNQCGFFGIRIRLVYVSAYDYRSKKPQTDDGAIIDTYSTHGIVILSGVDAIELERSSKFNVIELISKTAIMIKILPDNESFDVCVGGKLPESEKTKLGIKGNVDPPHGKWHIFDFLEQTDRMQKILSGLLKDLQKDYEDVVIHYVINMFPMKTVIYDPDVCDLG